jgi:WD40 repeat protein
VSLSTRPFQLINKMTEAQFREWEHWLAVEGQRRRTFAWGRAPRLLLGHLERVNAVAIAGDGRTAVSASDDHTLRVWEVESGRELRALSADNHAVRDVGLSADGQRAVSVSRKGTVRVWDVAEGRVLHTFEGYSDWAHGMAISADGHRAVSASDGNDLIIWNVDEGRELSIIPGVSYVIDVGLSADGRRAIAACEGIGSLLVFDADSCEEIRRLPSRTRLHRGTGSAKSLALSADGRRAVSGFADGTLEVWDVDDGRELQTLTAASGVAAVALSATGSRLVAASTDGTLRVWDLDNGRELHALAAASPVTAVALSATGTRLVSASADGTLEAWRLDLPVSESVYDLDPALAKVVEYSADGKRYIVGVRNGELKRLQELTDDGKPRALPGLQPKPSR